MHCTTNTVRCLDPPSHNGTHVSRVDFGEAEKQFQRILTLDPHRIDNIDIYSDILYVTDNRIKLSKLAHEFLEIDKDRPEVCCLVGKILASNIGAITSNRGFLPCYRKPLFSEIGTRKGHKIF